MQEEAGLAKGLLSWASYEQYDWMKKAGGKEFSPRVGDCSVLNKLSLGGYPDLCCWLSFRTLLPL
jgi:hypothetical protein